MGSQVSYCWGNELLIQKKKTLKRHSSVRLELKHNNSWFEKVKQSCKCGYSYIYTYIHTHTHTHTHTHIYIFLSSIYNERLQVLIFKTFFKITVSNS